MKQERDNENLTAGLTEAVYRAKHDVHAADDLVRQYLPFIKAECAKFLHRSPEEGRDDELGIAMFAFHESVLSYNRLRGSFLNYAALHIRSRLIDYYRTEQRHSGVLSLDSSDGEDGALIDHLAAAEDELAVREKQRAAREEIETLSADLASYGITLAAVAENCPRQQRTFEACGRVIHYAWAHTELLDTLVRTKKLPVGPLSKGAGVERKTIERHRTYLVAALLAYTNGFEIIRAHLNQVVVRKESVI